MSDFNVYNDKERAKAYAELDFPGTYYLAYRDLPVLISNYVKGTKAMDFGCGTGRSTRFLKGLGFDVIGIDVAVDMLEKARESDPEGMYLRVGADDFTQFESGSMNLVLSAFTFDNVRTRDEKVKLLGEINRLLSPEGSMINLVSSPEIYLHEWASFSTKDFPENETARSGDEVRIIITETTDKRPVVDVVWSDEDYREVYDISGLKTVAEHRPLADGTEPYQWINETRIAPWVIYVLRSKGRQPIV